MEPLTLVVMAAGLGSRYGGLKQLDPVGPGGETILDYSLYDAIRTGFARVVFVIRRENEAAFRETVAARFSSRIAIDYAFQELAAIPPTFVVPPGRSRPWGTAQAALVAADAIAGPFAVINADDFYGRQTFHLLADHLRGGSTDYAMAAYPLRATLSPFGTVSRGVCEVDSDGLLRAIVERTGIAPDGAIAGSELLGGDTLVSMNIWGFTPAIFPRLRDYFAHFLTEHGTDLKAEAFLPTFMDELIAVHRARVRVLQSADAWFGITYRADLPRVRERVRALIAAGDYPERLA